MPTALKETYQIRVLACSSLCGSRKRQLCLLCFQHLVPFRVPTCCEFLIFLKRMLGVCFAHESGYATVNSLDGPTYFPHCTAILPGVFVSRLEAASLCCYSFPCTGPAVPAHQGGNTSEGIRNVPAFPNK